MWEKIFIALLAAASVVSTLFAYFAFSWLRSIGAPADALDGYSYYSGFGWAAVLILSLLLVIVANIILSKTRRGWAIWATLLFFCIFTLVRYFLLQPAARDFSLVNGLATSISSLTPLSGIVFCLAAAAFAYFDQLLVLRLAARMHRHIEPDSLNAHPAPQPEIDETD